MKIYISIKHLKKVLLTVLLLSSIPVYSSMSISESKEIRHLFSKNLIYRIVQYRPIGSIIEFIKKNPWHIYKNPEFGKKILFKAIEEGNFELAKHLVLKEGVKPEVPRSLSIFKFKTTSLIVVAQMLEEYSDIDTLEKALEFVKLVVSSKKVKLNAQELLHKKTALHYIIEFIIANHQMETPEPESEEMTKKLAVTKTRIRVAKEMAELLVENRARVDIADENGFTPLDIAKNWGQVIDIEGKLFDLYKLLQTGKISLCRTAFGLLSKK